VLSKLKLPFFLILFTLFFWYWLPLAPTDTSKGFMLIKPVLAESTDTTFLEEEAGIAIYTHINQSLELFKAKSAFKTVEKETSNYIIGSVSLPNLPETDDVHSYIQKDGWIVVYYLKDEPVSKIIDWNWHSEGKIAKTKLEVGLKEVGNALEVTLTDVKYYHFQYPYANKWMIIVESRQGLGTDSCRVKIPSEFTFYERSWSHHNMGDGSWSRLRIDDTEINFATYGTATYYGQLTAAQLVPDAFHTVSIEVKGSSLDEAHVAIVLVYQESIGG